LAQLDVSDLFGALAHVGTVGGGEAAVPGVQGRRGGLLGLQPQQQEESLSYHMTVVSAEKADALQVMGKSGVTTGPLLKDKRLDDALGQDDRAAARLNILMGLYVISAPGRAAMEKERRNLVFRKTSAGG
jgi:hypothetical protein